MGISSLHLLIGLVLPLQLFALGLGEIRVYSHLNEPFRAEVPLLDVGGLRPNDIKASIAEPAEFTRLGLTRDDALALLNLKVKQV